MHAIAPIADVPAFAGNAFAHRLPRGARLNRGAAGVSGDAAVAVVTNDVVREKNGITPANGPGIGTRPGQMFKAEAVWLFRSVYLHALDGGRLCVTKGMDNEGQQDGR
ncbi:hypothetical protein MMARJ_19810 [Mycobacterium marseillense]|uniref:Uncharacterized protein n=1 Tax=Mycobacterium marseillense TaxID=701042 RepID=A0ABM7JBU4_9MYCO|nr:hypothetical protein MMARJ_19810 [Mycobacterium marseillense]